jgi:hypothetical protein
MTPINLVHDLLHPTDCICDGGDGRGHPRSAVVLRALPCRKDACRDQQDALRNFVQQLLIMRRAFREVLWTFTAW